MTRWKVLLAIALLAVAAVHFAAMPRSIWEFDESLFAAAVERYEPLRHNPPPPGYPLYIGFAKLVALLTPDAFTALLATSMMAVVVGFLAFVFAFARIVDLRTGVVGAVLLYTCPAVLVSGGLPQSDAGALALLGLAVWSAAAKLPPSKAAALLPHSILCALAIGWRLQLSIAIVPMLLVSVVMTRTWRDRIIAVGVFGVVCLTWFVPLVIEAGGPASYWGWLSGQAKYYAHHDADLSRSGYSAAHIALRFIAHPWGPKWLSLPLLVLALLGIRRNPRLIPLACGSLVYLGFALATMDPADAVRYAIPSLPLVALLAATTLSKRSAGLWAADVAASRAATRADGRQRGTLPYQPARDAGAPLFLVILYAAGSSWYTSPVLFARATSVAPPTAAIRWIQQHVSKNAVVLYDAPLWPHASYLLRDWNPMRVDAGLAKYGGDAAVPMVILADGERAGARGITFRWPDTDAYRKLTREHYGAVSVIPLPPSERYRVVHGVFAPERTRDGRAWRWISDKAVIELPRLGATRVRLTFRAPPEYPLEENRIRINDAIVTLKRNDTTEVIVPVGDHTIAITPERTFVPAKIRGANNRDARTLSIMLTGVEQIDPLPTSTESPRAQ